MSSKGWWDEDQESSRPNERVRWTSLQAAMQPMLSEDCVSSSQPPELEDESSQTKAAKRGMLVCQDDVVPSQVLVQRVLVVVVVVLLLLALVLTLQSWFWTDLVMLVVAILASMVPLWCQQVLMVFVGLLLVSSMFPFWLQEEVILQQLMPVRVLMLMLVWLVIVTMQRVMKNSWRARVQGHGKAHEWVLDSGAWIHHTSKLEVLLEGGDFQIQEMDNNDAPSSGEDGAPHVVQGRGSVRKGCFDFPGVHYVVGNDTRNVVSVSQLARDHGLVTVFEPTSCHVKDKKTGRIIGKGRLHNGMYMLDSLRIVDHYIGDRSSGASGGDGRDGSDGGGEGNGEEDSTAEGRGGGGRDGSGGERGTGARDQEEGSGSEAAGGDVNETNEEEGGDEEDSEEANENDEYEIGEINEEEDGTRGGQNFGQLFVLYCKKLITDHGLLIANCIFSIAACISIPYAISGAGVAVLVFGLFKTSTMHSTICKLKQMIGSLFRGTSGDREGTRTPGVYYIQELSHQEHNKRLFGLSRFDATTDPTGSRRRHLPARAFATSSTNAAARRPEEFFVDSGASFHTTWKESILFPYPQHLQNHTKPPTLSLGGIAAGSIAVSRSGYLNGGNIMLDGVLLALEAQANLVSVGQLSSCYGVQVEMDEVGVVIKKKQDGVRIGGGRMIGNLYVLEYFLPGGLFAHCYPTTPHP